jgi:hypothetical protein
VHGQFLAWGRSVVNAAAADLEAAIPGASRGSESHLAGYEALYVHFQDAKLPQRLAIWLFAAEEGTPNNFPGQRDIIGVGLKHDADAELERSAWRLRPLTPFSWRTHIDDRYAGMRWLQPAHDLDSDAQGAGRQLTERILIALRRSGAVKS